MNPRESYVPALAYSWLTGLYDPVVRLTTREAAFKSTLLDQAVLHAGQRVLDLACGTATLTIAAKMREPEIEITGLDGDPAILAIARRKAAEAGAKIRFDEGFSTALPYGEGEFDTVLCSLFFHHLGREAKLATLKELRRVLRPGGTLHIADWGEARNALMRFAFYGIQLLDGFENTADNVRGLLPQFARDSGFSTVEETRSFATMFGTLSLYRALGSG
jgi:ubiquinone/menaquinone biosynthesis C-methylase UbiE